MNPKFSHPETTKEKKSLIKYAFLRFSPKKKKNLNQGTGDIDNVIFKLKVWLPLTSLRKNLVEDISGRANNNKALGTDRWERPTTTLSYYRLKKVELEGAVPSHKLKAVGQWGRVPMAAQLLNVRTGNRGHPASQHSNTQPSQELKTHLSFRRLVFYYDDFY